MALYSVGFYSSYSGSEIRFLSFKSKTDGSYAQKFSSPIIINQLPKLRYKFFQQSPMPRWVSWLLRVFLALSGAPETKNWFLSYLPISPRSPYANVLISQHSQRLVDQTSSYVSLHHYSHVKVKLYCDVNLVLLKRVEVRNLKAQLSSQSSSLFITKSYLK